jgi:hypothetical protein
MTPADFEKNAALPAPGACDDGSGTAAVMELARVMSQYEFDKTLVFVAFAGEEQGLIGSSLQAAKAHKENVAIEAVLNNDIIGTDTSGNGRFGNTSVSVYSDETMDSPSQQLSRYAREIGERYMPSMKVTTIFMGDRLGRGGDHTPFQWEGYAAVRFSTPNEIYANQHHATDLLENMSVPYTAKVARVNGVVAASLALSPKPPVVMRIPPPPRADAAAESGRDASPPADAHDFARKIGLRCPAAMEARRSRGRHQGLHGGDSSHHVALLGAGNLRRESHAVPDEGRVDRRTEVRRESHRRGWRRESGVGVRVPCARRLRSRRFRKH